MTRQWGMPLISPQALRDRSAVAAVRADRRADRVRHRRQPLPPAGAQAPDRSRETAVYYVVMVVRRPQRAVRERHALLPREGLLGAWLMASPSRSPATGASPLGSSCVLSHLLGDQL